MPNENVTTQMTAAELLQRTLRIPQTRISGVRISWMAVVADVEPTTPAPICSGCYEPTEAVYDRKRGRWWRTQDLCGVRLELHYDLRRVDCATCGVTVELVPWAEPGSKFTWEFEQEAALLAQKCDKTTVSQVLRIAWNTVGTIIERVVKRNQRDDPLNGVTHIGVDELSYRKGHRYITIVVNQLTGKIIWMHPGKNEKTLALFFEALGERCKQIELVTLDMSAAYVAAVTTAVSHAKIVFDRFHVQRLVHDALDEVRRAEMREFGRTTPEAKALKGTRWATQKNPWNLTQKETDKLSNLQKTNAKLYRGYLLKEAILAVLDRRQVNVARQKLGEWISWALHSGLEPFARCARTLKKYVEGILAYIQTGFSNGRTEALNGKIRTITRRSFGFHRVESLMAMITLCCSGIHLGPAHRHPDPHPLAI
jgi:transposase